jgi:hypothetical protein
MGPCSGPFSRPPDAHRTILLSAENFNSAIYLGITYLIPVDEKKVENTS